VRPALGARSFFGFEENAVILSNWPNMTRDTDRELELTILMPCLNEVVTIAGCITEAMSALAAGGIRGEILIADNGSTDGSQQLAESLGARVIRVEARGYGSALSAGIAAARGRYVLMGDADMSYDFTHVDRFLAKLREGYDLVMGNRFRGGIQPGAMPWKNRYLGNPVLSLLGRVFFRIDIGDFHCGLRAFRTEAIRQIDLSTTGMEFASEMVIKARLHGLRITEVPTVLRPDKRTRPPHLRPWRDGWRHLRFMLLFSPRWLFLYPGLLLIAIGTGFGSRLLFGPWLIGHVTLDVHTLLFCSVMVLVGFQSISFAVLTKVFVQRVGLRPRDASVEFWLRWATLETGLLSGAALVFAGVSLSVSAVWFWRSRHFGALDPTHILRWVISGGTLIMLGCQIGLTTFYLSVLGLGVRSQSQPRA
jgi:glycosyltransferase involved in cell wall biosynthesis